MTGASGTSPSQSERLVRVTQVFPTLARSHGGPPNSGRGLAEGLARVGCSVDLCSLEWPERWGEDVAVDADLVRVHKTKPARGLLGQAVVPPAFRRHVEQLCRDSDIVHANMLWDPMNRLVADLCRKLPRPMVLGPRGCLSAGAFGRKAWKKRLGMILFARRNLRQAACLHALTARERDDVRRFGLTNPVAVIPNGVDLHDLSAAPGSPAEERWDALAGRKRLVFLGRLHPIKGLESLVPAWCEASRSHPEWVLVLAGPDEVGLRSKLDRVVSDAGAESRVLFTGPVYGEEKDALLRGADGFCLTSFTEGMSVSLLEGMSYSLPILFTRTCYFDEIEQRQAGLKAEPTQASIREQLERFLEASDEERQRMGRNGRRLVEDKYSWSAVASSMRGVYEWLLGRARQPDVVDNGPGTIR